MRFPLGVSLMCVLLSLCHSINYDNRPRIITRDGNLILAAAPDKNIVLQTSASVLLNGQDLSSLTLLAGNASSELRRLRDVEVAALRQNQEDLANQLGAGSDITQRLTYLEASLNNFTLLQGGNGTGGSSRQLRNINRRVRQLQNGLQAVQQLLERDECVSAPCRNGGTCIDSYNAYHCLCPEGWEGNSCDQDVNECAVYLGTTLGCQNGATCLNTPGSYQCRCASGFFGVHCTQRSNDCSTGSPDMCGRGVCLPHPGAAQGYVCLCQQGWTTDGINPACTVDINECQLTRPVCSTNPRVQCINTPGNYYCGPCPAGYTGNGHYCEDIDECLVNNGGCSQNPRVHCINTIGSRTCGPCPPGYQGDGVNCNYVGLCALNNGGCHPSAVCYENPAIGSSYVVCACRPGFTGTGLGPMGCIPISSGTGGDSSSSLQPIPRDPCFLNPCGSFGTCVSANGGFTCLCAPGFAGPTCAITVNPCQSSPCQNGATCVPNGVSFTCTCPSGFSGDYCQTQEQACGGYLTATEGQLTYPQEGGEYNHNVSCAWVIVTQPGQVLNLTFTRFHLEPSAQCSYDWLQINDGEDYNAPLVGKFCGENTPGGGNLVTSHNIVYLWFRSDHSRAGNGFALTWNTTAPVCGGMVNGTHGSINSPGYPGKYPHGRECYWYVQAPLGKRIQFVFATLQLEHHDNCSFDRLEIRDGLTTDDTLLGQYCSTANPAPVTTSGPYALLHFVSDLSLSDNGFHITWAAVPGVPGCGGLLTAPEGRVSSPNHPDTYEHNLDCEWVIRVGQEDRLTLNFEALSLERSSNCRFDFVEIREGNSPTGALIGRYCGNAIPTTPILSRGNQIFIRFRSDYSVASSGFRISYRTACGNTYTALEGILKSPGYPRPYPANRECTYVISLPPGKVIAMNFLAFDIEGSVNCLYDYLEVRDGDDANSTLVGRYCGPAQRTPPPIVSTHNYLWLKFRTDASIHNYGFMANYSAIDVACGGILTERQGVINSPRHPESYPHGATCRWVIRGPPGSVIRLQWMTFALEANANCRYDSVQVFDNTTVPGTGGLMGRYCGTRLPPTLTSSERTMSIVFQSDHSIAMDGFSATYVTLDASTVCGGTIFTENGRIRSPGFPTGYPPNRDCTWVIEAPTGRQIQLNFTSFQLETHGGCSFDYLEIRNGPLATSPLIGKFCGTTIPRIIPSHSHQLFLRFVSDSSVTHPGFEVLFESSATGCGGRLTGGSGSFASPSYPLPYSGNTECVWTIAVSSGSRVQLAFLDLDIGALSSSCDYNFVELRDGPLRSSKLIGRYCHNAAVTMPVVSTGSTLYIRYRSMFVGEGRGFNARFETLCTMLIKGVISGVIESPNFPGSYPHNRNCTWAIVAPQGNRINASFSHFEIEDPSNANCTYDYLEAREGPPSNRLIGHYCGSERLPPAIATTGDRLMIKFISDASVAHNGFRLEWRIDGCGGRLTKPRGSFTSPNYPQPYPTSVNCVWQIVVEPGSRVELTVADFDLESTHECHFDFLKVHGGPDDTSPVLSTLCHKQNNPVTVTSGGNMMFVHFQSDGTIQGKGFRASYVTAPQGCGGRFVGQSGVIYSSNYPQNYNNGDDCGYIIQVPANHVVELTFNDFDVEPHSNCTFDYVAVFDGDSEDAALLLRHCGDAVPNPPLVRSTSNTMYVRLKTDGSSTARGFKASYAMGCGARINTTEPGELLSPNFPGFTAGRLNCSWIILGPQPSDRVRLTITHLNAPTSAWAVLNSGPVGPINVADFGLSNNQTLNCALDFLQVLDGEGLDAPLLGQYCLNRVPAPVTSLGSALTVHMVSSGGRSGVTFRATYSVMDSACGGDFTSERGSFASPNFPDSYPMNTECIYTISASQGNKVMLSFRQFDIAETEFCNGDHVEIHENDATGPLLGSYCGSQIPANVTVANKLWVKFTSDSDSTVGGGFIADYSLIHGNELEGLGGVIESPMYPHLYTYPGEFHWRIITDSERSVQLRFLEFRVERHPMYGSCVASIIIHDGYDANAPVLGTYCGLNLPSMVYSTGNVVFVRFEMDYSLEGSLFRIRWDGVTNVPTSTSIGTTNNTRNGTVCGGEYYVTENNVTYLTSPGFPLGYAPNLNCIYHIVTEEHFRVSVTLEVVDMEAGNCQYDRIELREGIDSIGRNAVLGQYCRREDQGVVKVATGNRLTVVFRTDSSISRSGFRIAARAVCGGVLRSSSGVISSPNYPSNYPSASTCEWTIQVRPGRTIAFTLVSLNIASTAPACEGDYLMLRNGDHVDSPFLGDGRYCGNAVKTIPETASNKAHIKFVSDSRNEASGFQLRYREVSLACGGRFVLNQEVNEIIVTSPNYPAPPPRYAECEYVIVAPSISSIQLDFIDNFDITRSWGCRTAGVEVRDGGTANSPLVGNFCQDKPGTIYSSSNSLYFRYYTSAAEPKAGFRARISTARCGGTIVARSGVLTSPNYPSSYEPNTDCVWHIRGPVGHQMNVRFTQLDLPQATNCSSRDYVQIREVNATNEVLGTYCGRDLPAQIQSYTNEIIVAFHSSQRAESLQGFRLTFNASVDSCFGEFDSPTGVLTSPAYPNAYPHNRLCYWTIRAPPNRRVRLQFTDFDLEPPMLRRNLSSCFDYVYVTNGPTFMYPPLFPNVTNFYRCGSTLPEVVQSTSREMTVTFRTDGSLTHRGFRAEYTTDDPLPCGGSLTGSEGFFTSPGLLAGNQGAYNDSLYCTWTHSRGEEAINNSTLVLTLDFLDMEGPSQRSAACVYDILEFRAGIDDNGLALGQFCGNQSNGVQIFNPMVDTYIKFLTDFNIPGVGFNVSYKTSYCGGVINSAQAISSPGFGGNTYPANMDCVWLVDMSEFGQQIEVTFESFQLDSSDCSQDYLSIRNGRTPNSPEISRLCGSNLPAVIRSQSSYLWIHFHSNAEVGSGRGFRLRVEGLGSGCGGILHDLSGNVSSPSFPSRYGDNIECEWEIRLDPGYRVVLDFVERFDIEQSANCANDYVEVSDWRNETWVSLGKFCGKQLPSRLETASSAAKVAFRSNTGVNGQGFRINWKPTCGGNFTAEDGVIISPNYPIAYADNLTCTYVIHAPPTAFVALSFEGVFEIESHPVCYHDRVSVYQGNSTSGQPLGRYCGSTLPPRVTSRGPMTIQFRTDFSIVRRGFRATYSFQSCGGVVTTPSVIQSPAHPDVYYNNVNCTWLIQAPPNRVIDIKFETLSLEAQRICRYDWLALYEGSLINSANLVARLCGNFSVDLPRFTSRTNQMLANFRTDWSTSHGGFSAAIRFTLGENQGCGGRVNVSNGPQTLRSPEERNDGELNCGWIITAAAGQVIRFTLTRLDLEQPVANTCDYEYLEVRDGAGPGASSMGRFCGVVPPPAVVSSGNFLFVRLVTGSSGRVSSFVATVSQQEALCGSNVVQVTGSTQVLSSPNYGSAMSPNLRCRWVLDAAVENQPIDLHFLDFALGQNASDGRCSDHRLEIQDLPQGLEVNSNVTNLILNGDGANMVNMGSQRFVIQREIGQLLTFCGTLKPHDIFSTGRSLAVTLVTGNPAVGRGFRLQYSLATCNRTYEGAQGRIVSPNYPNMYPPNQLCVFKIQAPPSSTIAVYFSTFRLQNSNNCTASSLQVRDGDNEQAPLLANLCGASLPNPIFSTGNQLHFIFQSARFSLRGYDVTYTTTTAGSGCGGSIFNTRGSFTSPGYPVIQNISSDCRWEVSVPLGMQIKLEFPVFTIGPVDDCASTFMELYDVSTRDNTNPVETLRSRYCAHDRPAPVIGSSNSLTLRFVTGSNSTGVGFRATFQAVTLNG